MRDHRNMPKVCRNHHNPDWVTGRRCMNEATTRDGYCGSCKAKAKHKALYARTRQRSLNRANGLCRCGAEPRPDWRTCHWCHALDQARNRRRREKRRAEKAFLAQSGIFPTFGRRVQRRLMKLNELMLARGIVRLPETLTPSERRAKERADRRSAFVQAYVRNGGNGERAALTAGYGVESAKQGGRAAHVRAHKLLRDPSILEAIAVEQARLA